MGIPTFFRSIFSLNFPSNELDRVRRSFSFPFSRARFPVPIFAHAQRFPLARTELLSRAVPRAPRAEIIVHHRSLRSARKFRGPFLRLAALTLIACAGFFICAGTEHERLQNLRARSFPPAARRALHCAAHIVKNARRTIPHLWCVSHFVIRPREGQTKIIFRAGSTRRARSWCAVCSVRCAVRAHVRKQSTAKLDGAGNAGTIILLSGRSGRNLMVLPRRPALTGR